MMKIKYSLIFLFLLQISCNKNGNNNDNSDVDSTNYSTSANENQVNKTYEPSNPRDDYRYGFAVFEVYNDTHRRLNEIRRPDSNQSEYPVNYYVVSQITTFKNGLLEEEKYRVLDREEQNLSGNLKVLNREYLVFSTYEEASVSRSEYK